MALLGRCLQHVLAVADAVLTFISATYRDPDGFEVATDENTDGPRPTLRRDAPVGADSTTIHRVYFNEVIVGACATNCELDATCSK
jgi:hypothetical protein